jgi:hypothetical protein
MKQYIQAWHTTALGQNVTAAWAMPSIQPPVGPGFSAAGLDALTMEAYPFYSPADPNGLRSFKSASDTYINSWIRTLPGLTSRPWVMPQIFQQSLGGIQKDGNSNVEYTSASCPIWIMPTPSEVLWQAYTSIAEGNKGIFFFMYSPTSTSISADTACNFPLFTTTTDSGSPENMVYPNGSSTPQYEAMSHAYLWIHIHSSILTNAAPDTSLSVSQAPPSTTGNVVSLLKDSTTQKQYIMVVASPEGSGATNTVNISLDPRIVGLADADTGKPLMITSNQTHIILPLGSAALLTVTTMGATATN